MADNDDNISYGSPGTTEHSPQVGYYEHLRGDEADPRDDSGVTDQLRGDLKRDWKEQTSHRIEREIAYLNGLTERQISSIEEFLTLIELTRSTWLLGLFKYAVSAREDELNSIRKTHSSNFENQGGFWYEAGWNIKLQKKLRTAVTSALPIFFRDWLDRFRVIRQSSKSLK